MSENVKSFKQRLKILYLYKILLDYTDEDHYITMPEIIKKLDMCGIAAGRKALYSDIEALRIYGLDIITMKGSTSGYYVASRDFELAELKLLADAVSSSRFLTQKKSDELLKKIEGLASKYEAKQLHRQVFIANRVKAMNELIYINVDIIHKAINENKKISFKYFEYDIHKNKKYHDGIRTCSPYALLWDDEKYYLTAFYDNRNIIANLRIDRMESVEIIDEKAMEKPADFDVADYIKSSFSMFSGKAQNVKLRFDNKLISTVIDRFGSGTVVVPDGEDHFTVRVNVKAEQPQPFFSWLFKFGTKAEIVEPQELKNKYIENLKAVLTANEREEDNNEKGKNS